MPNDYNSNEAHEQYVAEAKAMARAEAARHEGQPTYKPLPPAAGGLPASAFPPGVNPEEYLAKMVGRAEAGSQRDGVVSSNDYGKLPPAQAGNLAPLSAGGFTKTLAQLQPGGTIQYQGTRIEAEQAVALGLLQRDPAGGYRLPTSSELAAEAAAEREVQRQQEEEQVANTDALRAAGDLPDNVTMQAMVEVSQVVPSDTVHSLVRDVVTNDGTVSLANVTEAARRAGMTAEQGQTLFTNAYNGYLRQAETAARSVGVAAEHVGELWSWAAQKYKGDHQLAVHALVLGGDASAIKGLARKFAAWKRGQQA
jgi:hypothetical protein